MYRSIKAVKPLGGTATRCKKKLVPVRDNIGLRPLLHGLGRSIEPEFVVLAIDAYKTRVRA